MSLRLLPLLPVGLSLALCLTACAAHHADWFSDTGFHVNTDRYGFRYLDAYPNLLPPGWTVDNFVMEGRSPQIKIRGAYQQTVSWTMVSGDIKKAHLVTHDLLFRHRDSNGVIWVRRLPLPRASRDKAVAVLAENYANNISGSVYEAQLGGSVDERRVSTKLTSSAPLQLGTHAGHDVTFELVDLNQLELDPAAPRTRVRIVMATGDFDKPIALSTGQRIASSAGSARVPAVLLLGYANDASVFDAHAADFQDLLTRLWIR